MTLAPIPTGAGGPGKAEAKLTALGVGTLPRRQAHGLTDAEIGRRCRESRLAQGLPPTIVDGPTLDKIAVLLRSLRVDPQ